MISRVVDRALHTVSLRPPYVVPGDVLALHRQAPAVDLVVGTALFRRDFLRRRNTGHLDLARLSEAGVRVVGLSLATRFPDLRGTLSAPHFGSLALPGRGASNMAVAEALIDRIDSWVERSAGRLRLIRSSADIAWALEPGDRVAAFIGVQGGHVLDGTPRNVERLRARGVMMLALAHVMDNELIGSGSGRRSHGLTGLGREVIAELERREIIVDLAHASSAGIRDALPRLTRPFVLSHTGFTEVAGGRSRWRRYSAATRNLARDDALRVAEAGGLIGISCATRLLGGEGLGPLVRAFRYAAELVGVERVCLGSDFDGALRTTFDVTGLPLLTGALRDAGFSPSDIAAVMGGNALRLLRASLVPG